MTEDIIKKAYEGYDENFVASIIKCNNVMQSLVPVELVACSAFMLNEQAVATWTFKIISDESLKPKVLGFIADQLVKFFTLITDNDAIITGIHNYSIGDTQIISATYYIS